MRGARYVSLAALAPCPPLLILDLGRPDRALHMFRIVKLKSPMSLGSWTLLLVGLFSAPVVGLQLLSDLAGREILRGVQSALGVIALPFAFLLSGYTGVLLTATNVPVWARNHLLLGPTFVTSAFSSGLSAVSLVLRLTGSENAATSKALARAEAVCLTAELALMIAGLVRLGKFQRPLTRGRVGWLFWPITVLGGIVAPLALLLSGPVWGKKGSESKATLAALLALTGSFVFRAVMIFAGRESARRPQDYFEYTSKPEPAR